MESLISSFSAEKTGFFRFRELDGKYLLTNDAGDFVFLSKTAFKNLVSGKLKNTDKNYQTLLEYGFVKEKKEAESSNGNEEKYGLSASEELHYIPSRWFKKNSFLFSGPSLHIVVITRQCNMSCVYCHAAAGKSHSMAMTIETAKKVLDIIFKTPSKAINIEFQGGEPLLNWPVLEYIVIEAEKKAKRTGKNPVFSLVSNLTVMNDDMFDFLIKHNVGICTSLDGHKQLHNKNRVLIVGNGDSHASVKKWIPVLREKKGENEANALLTVTKDSLTEWKNIIDEYVSLGMQAIFIRFLNPFGMARKNWKNIGYTPEEYVDFYKKSMDYIIELNNSGKSKIVERTAQIFLRKIFAQNDPGFLDLRSPCGAGIGQIAYNYDGSVYTCDEGRMLAAMGDESFCIGHAGKDTYRKMINSSVVKSMVTASINDLQPACSNCVYKPYCGVCPIFNYADHGDLFMYGMNYRCRIYKGILDYLFTIIYNKKERELLQKWISL